MTIQFLALYPLLAIVAALVIAGGRARLHPFPVLIAAAVALGLAASTSFPSTIRATTNGFVVGMASAGIAVVAGVIIGAALERTAATERIAARLLPEAGRPQRGLALLALGGWTLGLGASLEAAVALPSSVGRAIARRCGRGEAAGGTALGLSALATHCLAVPAPGPIAAAAILGADLRLTAAIGLPLAALSAAIAWAWALRAPPAADAVETAAPGDAAGGRLAVAALPLAVPLLMLLTDALSAPFDVGRHFFELVRAIGEPMALFVVGLALAVALAPRPRAGGLGEDGWLARALLRAAPAALVVAAAASVAEAMRGAGLGEAIADALAAAPIGLLLPFAVAAAMKLAQGAAVPAIITAAGVTEPLLGPLGLDDATGRALAAVTAGAGAMLAPHVNDTYFWSVAQTWSMSADAAVRRVTLGATVQSLAALGSLAVLAGLLR